METQSQKDMMKQWFLERYENPAERTPFESAEGGYQYIWGGPYDAYGVLSDAFYGAVEDELIEETAQELEDEIGCVEWTRAPDLYEIDAALGENTQQSGVSVNLASMRMLLQEKDLMEPSLHKFQLMMIFGFCITILEARLSDIFIRKVFSDEKYKQKYLEAERSLAEQKFSLAELFEKHKNIDALIKEKLANTTFHNIASTQGLYKKVLDIDFGDIAELIRHVNKRHDFIHRGGKDKNGNDVTTSKQEVEGLIDLIESFCRILDSKIQ